MKTILAVDDQKNSLKVLSAILTDEGYRVWQATSAEEALKIFEQAGPVHAVLSDLKMPKMDGIELFRAMAARGQVPPFIIMTAYGTVKSAVQALKEGITHYLIKPLDYEELSIVLEKAIKEREMSEELDSLKERVLREDAFHGIIGNSRKMTDIYEMVKTVGPTDVSVLIYGQTGTGKELLARALHLESSRRQSEIVCINSAALAENLLEAELFGYVKGAFTGAVADRKGRLEMAHNGTLFLDEIGQMSLRLQSKLLRFLQEMTFEPVGGAATKKVDVRIIAATNLDLQEEFEKGRFLRDLLYRIEVIKIQLPPLRQRKEDIALLVQHFIERYAQKHQKPVKGIEPEAAGALVGYSWPGNVRELKNYIERAVILSKKPMLGLDDLPAICIEGGRKAEDADRCFPVSSLSGDGVTLQEMEKELILSTLKKCEGNKSRAALKLGISRKALYEKMARHGLRMQRAASG